MNYDNFIEKMGGPQGREICHENFTGESSSPVKLMSRAEVASLFPGVTLTSSDYMAYLPAIMCRSLPVVNKRGRCFTPRVMDKSAASAQHGLVDLEHILRDNDFKRDVIVGHIAAVNFGGRANLALAHELPLVPDQAMPLSVLLALYMRTDSVPRILEEHLTGKCQWGTSMECYYQWKDCAFWYENEFIPTADAPHDMLDCVTPNAVSRYKDKPLAVALGGKDSAIDFCAIGLTASPADKGSGILALMASRDMASTGKTYYPVHISLKRGDWKNSEEAVEIASAHADEKFKELAAIEVMGQTKPAEDGHLHDVLTDGTIVPANGHTHFSQSMHIARGTNPRFTARTSEHYIYPPSSDGMASLPAVVHFHLIDIPLRGGKKKDSAETASDEGPAELDVANLVADFRESLHTLLSSEDTMASKLSDLLAKLEKALVVSPGKSVADTGNTELAGVLEAIRAFRIEDEIKDAASKQVASLTTAGDILTKADHEKKLADAVDVKEKELTAKFKAEQDAAKALVDRLGKVTAAGVDLDHTPEGADKTLRQKFSGYTFDQHGDALFSADLRALQLEVELVKERSKPAPTTTATPELQAANTGKPVKKVPFLIGGKAPEGKELANAGAVGGKSFLARYAQ